MVERKRRSKTTERGQVPTAEAQPEADAAVGHRLRRLRKLLGMSQGELAKRAGVARNTVVRYEQGDFGHMKGLESITEALALPIDVLFQSIKEAAAFERFLSDRWSTLRPDLGLSPLSADRIADLNRRIAPVLDRVDSRMKSERDESWREIRLPHQDEPQIEEVAALVAGGHQAVIKEVLILLFDKLPDGLRQEMVAETRGLVRGVTMELRLGTSNPKST